MDQGSISEVNVNDDIKTELHHFITNDAEDFQWKNAMANFERELIINMTDPFSRFVKSLAYRGVSIQLEMHNAELLAKNLV